MFPSFLHKEKKRKEKKELNIREDKKKILVRNFLSHIPEFFKKKKNKVKIC